MQPRLTSHGPDTNTRQDLLEYLGSRFTAHYSLLAAALIHSLLGAGQ